jgi:large conductance mechanosensitive channel
VLTSLGVNELDKLTFNGIKYGVFLAAVLNFIVIAFVIFVMIQALEKFKRQEAVAAEEAAVPDPALESQERLTTTLDRLARALENRGA